MIALAEDEWYDNTIAPGDAGSITNKNSAGTYFSESVTGGNTSGWTINNSPCWLNGVPISFWSWAPSSLSAGTRTITNPGVGDTDLSFTYTLPVGGHVTSGVPDDAARQSDLIFAFNPSESRLFDDTGTITDAVGTHKTSDKDDINIHFYHATAEVNFAISVEDGEFDLALVNNILKISLVNVAHSATCVFHGSKAAAQTSSPVTPLPSDIFEWGAPSGEGTYTQAYTLNNVGYSEDGTAVVGGHTYPTMSEMRANQQSFMVIPQTTGETAVISVLFEYFDTDGVLQSLSRSFSIAGQEWKAGYYYTYKIKASSIGRDIHFELSLLDWGTDNEAIIV